MKQFLTALLCLLLCGCASPQQTVPTEPAPQDPRKSISIGMYDPGHPMEERYPGEVRGYSLTQRKVHGLCAFGSDLLILSGQGNTTLMVLSGEDLHQAGARTVGFELTQEDPSLQIHENCLSYFDSLRQETVLLDQRLQEIRTIAVPKEISGKPILSSDTTTLYYCTPWSIVAWNLESGIRRTVKELQYASQELSALYQGDEILACTVTEGSQTKVLLLSAENGMELHTLPEGAALTTTESGYFLSHYDGFLNLMIFSRKDSGKQMLLPESLSDEQYYLEENHAVITVREQKDNVILDYYDLEHGTLAASLALDPLQTPKAITNSRDHAIYILVYDPAADCDTIYLWDIPAPASDSSESAIYTFPYPEENAPDLEALEQCREYARSIGQKYGITLKLWEDACETQPWDYRFTPEYLAPVLQKELQLLDQRLSSYPEGILSQTIEHFSGLTICLVRSIAGNSESNALASPTGIQFFQDNHAYVAITTGKHSEQALYHELYHVMETHILTKSSALDQWEALNPAGFTYGNMEAMEVYLQRQTRAFADSYSMRSSKEDRARILENAMLSGKEELFRSEYMQRKLTAICQGIREAYGLRKTTEILPWERYLVTPLAPKA